jgi:hypothetical protein
MCEHDNSRRENTFPVPEEERKSMAAAKKSSHAFNRCGNCDHWWGCRTAAGPRLAFCDYHKTDVDVDDTCGFGETRRSHV